MTKVPISALCLHTDGLLRYRTFVPCCRTDSLGIMKLVLFRYRALEAYPDERSFHEAISSN